MISKETVIDNLETLKLHRMVEMLDPEIEEAHREARDHLEVIGRLTEAQVRVNWERKIQRRMKEARFPEIKTLEGFDWDFQPTLDRSRVFELTRLDFIRKRQNVLLAGNSGTGKSHIAKAIGVLACGAGFRVRFTSCEAMFRDLLAAQCDHTLPERLKIYTLPDLLLVDDLGFEEIEIKEAGNANLLLKVVNARYEKRSTIIASNISLDSWGQYLHDPVIAMATLDRFVHHAVLFHIDGPSYRDHQCKQMEINQPRPESAKTKASNKTGSRRASGAVAAV